MTDGSFSNTSAKGISLQVVVTDERFFDLFRKYNGFEKNEIKMKRPQQLLEVLELARQILQEQQVVIGFSEGFTLGKLDPII